MQPRRQQPPITIRSARAAELLKRHAVNGRSQAQVIEEALERLPLPGGDEDHEALLQARMAKLDAALAHVRPHPIGTMAAFDADEYDEWGSPR